MRPLNNVFDLYTILYKNGLFTTKEIGGSGIENLTMVRAKTVLLCFYFFIYNKNLKFTNSCNTRHVQNILLACFFRVAEQLQLTRHDTVSLDFYFNYIIIVKNDTFI
jgi:hypothetical protein